MKYLLLSLLISISVFAQDINKLDENGKKTMPISVHVHHGLVDGYHVGLFLDALQQLMNA